MKRELPVSSLKTQKALAEAVGVGQSEITRCLKPWSDPESVTTLELVIAISDALKLPYPVIIPDTEQLALKLTEERRIFKSLIELAEIKAGVTGNTQESQTVVPQSEDASRKRASKRKGSAGSSARQRRVRAG